jgi:hypothetical protein
MRKSQKRRTKSKLGKAATGLLAAAGAMLLPKAAKATMVTESTDFSNDFAGRNSLAPGVDSVQGTLQLAEGFADPADYFVFTGLQPGANFNLQITFVDDQGGTPSTMTLEWRPEPTGSPVLNSTSVSAPSQTSSFMGIVPLNGNIAADVGINGGFSPSANPIYGVNLTVQPLQNVPDSGGTMMLMGAAVAGLALAKKLKRRRKKA